MGVLSFEADRAWRRAARAELRRTRRYLLALTRGLSEEELEWVGEADELSCAKWHVGHLAVREREMLGPLVPALAGEDGVRHPRFGEQVRAAPTDLPSWRELEAELAASRRLTESLLALVPVREPLSALVLGIVNHEYEHARYVRVLRRELGRGDVPEPTGRLLRLDTDCDAPPRFHVESLEPAKAPARRGETPVVSLQQHRRQRAVSALDRGHQSVSRGDYRDALASFRAAHDWQPSADALTYQGWMLSLLGDAEAAERACLEAIRLDPDFGNPYNDIGTLCLRRKDVEEAVRWFEKAKRAPRYEPRHFPYVNLGRLYLSLGMPEKALSEFEGALVHDPENPEVRQAVQQIRRELSRRDA